MVDLKREHARREGEWRRLRTKMTDYWTRFNRAGSGLGAVAPMPEFWFEAATGRGSVVIGGESAWKHSPMTHSDEVRILYDGLSTSKKGVLLGRPPRALVYGYQRLRLDLTGDASRWFIDDYKYCVLISDRGAAASRATWFGLRLESDPHAGRNSWLLNHPVHHFQLGSCNELRLHAGQGRSLISFVDLMLRAFAVDAWRKMYPELYRELKSGHQKKASEMRRGSFDWITGTPSSEPALVIGRDDWDKLAKLLSEGRSDGRRWYKELELWRDDIADHSACAPELFDMFLNDGLRV